MTKEYFCQTLENTLIEYILARPFIALFSLSAIQYVLTYYIYESQYKELFLISFAILFGLILYIGFFKKYKSIVVLLILPALFLKDFLHLKLTHKDPLNENANSGYTVLLVEKASLFNDQIAIDAQVISKNDAPTARINIPAKKINTFPVYGDTIICFAELKRIKPVMSRYFNNYNNYLLNNHIFYKAKLNDSVFILRRNSGFSALAFAQNISQQCKKIFLTYIPDASIANLMIALLLGDKSDLDKQIKKDFINTGTAHILAVSGLHLGMIYLLIQNAMKIIKRNRFAFKTGWLDVIAILILIWLFALISGLSTSVVRAAIMLSLLEFGKLLKRNSDPVNSLFACGFLMTFHNPCTLYDVGFQLSFMAVLSIILFNSYLLRFYNTGNIVLSKIRDLIGVTLSVQVLVTPPSIYYFQQFPLYFILSNIIWVPLSFILMVLGIALICFSLIIPIIAGIIGKICMNLCGAGLAGFEFIRKLPFSKFDGLWIYNEQFILFTLSCILIFIWLKFNNKISFFLSIGSFILIPIIYFIRIEYQKRTNELVCYYEGKSFQADLRKGNTVYTTLPESMVMENYRTAFHISRLVSINTYTLNELLNQNKVIINSLDTDSCEFKSIHNATRYDPIIVANPEHSINDITQSEILFMNASSRQQNQCTILKDHSPTLLHHLIEDGPFTLKF